MRRPVSPLLHDYKPNADRKPGKAKAIKWFGVGVGIPILGLALFSVLIEPPKAPAPSTETPVMTSAEPAETAVIEQSAEPTSLEPAEKVFTESPMVLLDPEPAFENLTLYSVSLYSNPVAYLFFCMSFFVLKGVTKFLIKIKYG